MSHNLDPGQSMTLTTASVASMLGMSEATFRKKRNALERAHNFPARLPVIGRYSRPALERWIATNGQTHQPKPDPELDEISAQLEAEFAPRPKIAYAGKPRGKAA